MIGTPYVAGQGKKERSRGLKQQLQQTYKNP